MSEQEWAELYKALGQAVGESSVNQSEVDWFVLMAAQRIAYTRLMAVKYPEQVPA